MEFVWIPPGTFMMGSPEAEPGRRENEKQHRVTLTKGFHMQTTEVTGDQWKAVMGDKGRADYWECGNCPAIEVSWGTAQDFIKKLNELEGGSSYRLPTEAEWEYAARAGSTTRFSFGDDDGKLGDYAWYSSNSDRGPHPVGEKSPNAWGLYDMHGNAFEWCEDWYGDYPTGAVTDPTGPDSGTPVTGAMGHEYPGHKVYRGGSWDHKPKQLRSAYRSRSVIWGTYNAIGVRLVRTP